MATHPDALIVGGGVIGLTSAYFLARDGASVRLLDQAALGSEASWAGAGIIPPGNPEKAATAFDRLRAVSSSMFPALSAELLDRTGIDNGYRVCGCIEFFDETAEEAAALWSREGIEFEAINEAEIGRLEPQLNWRGGSCFVLPGMAQVRNPWHIRALVAACRSVGVVFDVGVAVQSFRTDGERVVSAVAADGTEFRAGQFLVANGAWADVLLQTLGVSPGIHPVRGQIVLFRPPRPLVGRIVSVGKCYLVPRGDGRVLAGATEEPEAGFEKANTREGVTALVEFATGLIPALGDAQVERAWAGLRPGSPDGLPFLGAVPGFANAYFAGGHFRAGIQLSPATGIVMADLIAGRQPSIPLADFRLDRPPAPPFAAAFRS